LGPPSSGYSITSQTPAGAVVELSDRWAQSLVLKRLAEDAWAGAGAVIEWPRASG